MGGTGLFSFFCDDESSLSKRSARNVFKSHSCPSHELMAQKIKKLFYRAQLQQQTLSHLFSSLLITLHIENRLPSVYLSSKVHLNWYKCKRHSSCGWHWDVLFFQSDDESNLSKRSARNVFRSHYSSYNTMDPFTINVPFSFLILIVNKIHDTLNIKEYICQKRIHGIRDCD